MENVRGLIHGDAIAFDGNEVALMLFEEGKLTVVLKGNSTPVVVHNGGGRMFEIWKAWAQKQQ